MITIKYSCQKRVDVNKGLAKNWIRYFVNDDVRVPEGWVGAVEANDRMVSFAFVRINGAKTVPNGEYIMVIQKGTRAEALGMEIGGFKNPTYYIMPVMAVLRPTPEDAAPTMNLNLDDYLKNVSLYHYTEQQATQWRKEKKVRFA